MGMSAASAVFSTLRSPTSAVQRSARDLKRTERELSRYHSMARIKRFLPAIVMVFTIALGAAGTLIADAEVVRAATTTNADTVTESAPQAVTPIQSVAVPGYPY